MPIRIYNSLTRSKDPFIPIKPNTIGMYVCGPTVYGEPHIGHARSAYIFDVIRKYFMHRGFAVTFVRNVTDVDDKIIDKARKMKGAEGAVGDDLIKLSTEVAHKYLAEYHEYMDKFGILRPDNEPKATEYIPKMIKFIELLISRGAAYSSGGDVYFDISKAAGYGKLSGQDVDNMASGARAISGELKRNPLDFALWKAAKEGEPSWTSPWGPGRPGWHIECSAMSSDILGDEFDIHGGGVDLIFPHHENEVAQSEGAGKHFARYWIHNGLLTINGEKMAKSLGNFVPMDDFLKQYHDPDLLKLLFLSTHYRHPVDYTEEKIDEMRKEKERFVIFAERARRLANQNQDAVKDVACRHQVRPQAGNNDIEDFKARFESAMDDDFNTPMALSVLFELVTHVNKRFHGREKLLLGEISYMEEASELIEGSLAIFGIELSQHGDETDASTIQKKIDERNAARKARDFARSDAIRKELSDEGIVLEDTKDGTVWRKKS